MKRKEGPPKVLDIATMNSHVKSDKAIHKELVPIDESNRDLSLRRVPAPPALQEGEESKYVTKQIQRLSPHAIRELEDQLLYSPDPKDRREVANRVLDMAGHSKKESGQLGSSPLVVVVGVDKENLPWVSAKTVDGQVTNVEVKKPDASST